MSLMVLSTVGMLVFGGLAGVCYALMGWELGRKGRRTKYLSLSFDPRVRIRIGRVVFENYRQLKQSEGQPAVLPWLVWTSVVLSVAFMGLYVVAALL